MYIFKENFSRKCKHSINKIISYVSTFRRLISIDRQLTIRLCHCYHTQYTCEISKLYLYFDLFKKIKTNYIIFTCHAFGV